MEFMNDYMVMVIVGICLCVGFLIKHTIPSDAVNRFIPLIVGVLGVILNIWMNGWCISPEILLGGLVSGLASTGMYELFRQFLGWKKEEE